MKYNDDEIDLRAMERMSVDEILHGTEDDKDHDECIYMETKEEMLEFERDFIAVSERLINHDLTQEEATKQAIMQMREYYTEPDGSCKDKEIDTWLKEQENKYQIGSCYFDDESWDGDSHPEDYDESYDYDIDNLSDHAAFEDDYTDQGYDIPELWCDAGMSDEQLLDVCFETNPDHEIHDKQ